MDFRILGPLEVYEGEQSIPLPSGRHRAVLALLLVHANEVVPTDRLIDELWHGQPTENATTALYGYVSQLRKALGSGRGGQALLTRSPGYVIELDPEQLDATRAQGLVAAGRTALRGGDAAEASARLREALALWRGPPLAEFAFESFAQPEIRRLEELRWAALEERIEADLELGHHFDVIGELEGLVAAEPLRERLRRQLMLSLYRAGRQAEALEAYQDARRALVAELGIEPAKSLRELEQAILRQDPALDAVPESAVAVEDAAEPVEERPEPAPLEERKLVSVLLIELVDARARSGLADPEDVRDALQPFHAAARHEIERRGGAIEKLLGEQAMAIFGVPTAHEDDPERAVRAALAISTSLADVGEGLQTRIAVNTGIALVSLADRAQDDGVATGDVVTTAQRMQAAAPIDGILVAEQTYRATRHAIDYREPQQLEVGGKTIATWEPIEARSRLGVDLLRGPTSPFTGRRRELDLLVSSFARVREARSPELVTLVGVPGIGKSRLVYELAKVVDADRELITWRQGRCLPYGDGVSFWALGEIVKAEAGILESDSPQQAEAKLHDAVIALFHEESEAQWIERQLWPLVGIGARPDPAEERSAEAPAAWQRFLEKVADARPFVIVFEDLHWADESLLEFVDELAERVRSVSLLVLCTARPELLERQPSWGGGKANALTISLSPLTDEETESLVASLLERPLLDAEVRRKMLARAEGNPFYAEQFGRALEELGSLDELPESVHGIIASRLDGLSAEEKALLQDAAVVGKVFWLGALEAIGNVGRREAAELLFGLERKEFAQRARGSSVAGESEYTFRHVLLRDVAYGQIPRARRGEKHRRAATWTESLGRSEDHAEMLAHHYLSALQYTKAAGADDPGLVEHARFALRAAGDRALALASYTGASSFYSTALDLWPEADSERADLLVRAGRASFQAHGSGAELIEQGFEELRSAGNVEGAAEAAVELAQVSWFRGDRDLAYSYVDRALELTEGRASSSARAQAVVADAAFHMLASDFPEAIRLAREALPLVEALRLDGLQVRALEVLGVARALSGDAGGLDDSKRAIALARERNAVAQLAVAEDNLYAAQFALGQLDAAAETLQMHLSDVTRYGRAADKTWARGAQAYQAVLHGRWDEALGISDDLFTELERAVPYLKSTWHAHRGSIELARGDIAGASEESYEALEIARRAKDPQILAPALAFRAIVLFAQGLQTEASQLASEVLGFRPVSSVLMQERPAATLIEFTWLLRDLGREEELLRAVESDPSTPWLDAARAIADGAFVRAVELVTRIGAPSVDAYTRLRAAQELVRVGQHEQARKELAPAIAFFEQVSARRYLEQAQQLLVSI